MEWTTELDVRGLPATAGSLVYALAAGGQLVALDVDTGQLRWRRRISDETTNISGTAVVAGSDLVITGGYDVVAVDRLSGLERWRFRPTPDQGYGPGFYIGDVSDGVVLCGSPAGMVYALDELTGRLRWSAVASALPQTTVFWPRVAQGIAFGGYTTFAPVNAGGLVAWDVATGRELWRHSFGSGEKRENTAFAGGPVVTDDEVIFADARGTLHGIEVKSGRTRWVIRWQAPDLAGPSTSVEFRALAATSELLIAASLRGVVIAYDLVTRQERWRYFDERNGSAGFRLLVTDGQVIVPYIGAGFVSLDLTDGREQWRSIGLQGLLWPPVVAGRRLFATVPGIGVLALSLR